MSSQSDNSCNYPCFLQADKAHVIFSQATVFIKTFLRNFSDDNKCMDDNDKHMMMITNLRYMCAHMHTHACAHTHLCNEYIV